MPRKKSTVRKDLYAEYAKDDDPHGTKARLSFVSNDDMFKPSKSTQEFDSFEAAFNDDDDEIQSLAAGLLGSDIESLASDSEYGRGRSVSDSLSMSTVSTSSHAAGRRADEREAFDFMSGFQVVREDSDEEDGEAVENKSGSAGASASDGEHVGKEEEEVEEEFEMGRRDGPRKTTSQTSKKLSTKRTSSEGKKKKREDRPSSGKKRSSKERRSKPNRSSDSSASTTASSAADNRTSKAHSKADFEDVYPQFKKTKKKGKKGTGAEKFEFQNPGQWSHKAATTQALYHVLSTPGSTVDKARRLFVLEQLEQPAPPETPPSFWGRPGGIGRPIKERKQLSWQRENLPKYKVDDEIHIKKRLCKEGTMLWPDFQSMAATAAAANTPKPPSPPSPKGRVATLPRVKQARKLEEKRLAIPESHVWNLSKLLDSSTKVHISWLTRVRILRGVTVILKSMHTISRVYSDLSLDNVLVNRDLMIRLRDTGTIVNTESQHYRVTHRKVNPEDLMAYETLRVGVLILQLVTLGSPRTPLTPLLDELVTDEDKAINMPDDDPKKLAMLNKLECLALPLEKELRAVLDAQEGCPNALRELCIQSCDPVRANRPDAVDQWDWLDSVLEDAEKDTPDTGSVRKVLANATTGGSKKGKKGKGKKGAPVAMMGGLGSEFEDANDILEMLVTKFNKKPIFEEGAALVNIEKLVSLATSNQREIAKLDAPPPVDMAAAAADAAMQKAKVLAEDGSDGYDTDDSFQPPKPKPRPVSTAGAMSSFLSKKRNSDPVKQTEEEEKEGNKPGNRTSRLLDFLNANASGFNGSTSGSESDTGSVMSEATGLARKKNKPKMPPRKPSLTGKTGSSSSLAAEDTSGAPEPARFDKDGNLATTFVGFTDTVGAHGVGRPITKDEKQPRRRRSLDRGYEYARARFSRQDKKDSNSKGPLVADANINRFKEAWVGKQVRLNNVKIPAPEELAKTLEQQELLPLEVAVAIVKKATSIMKKEANLLMLSAPVTVVGDIHGQFFDLRNMMQIGGPVGRKKGQSSYLFLGDYVDRGEFSCETLLYLMALKCKHKDAIWLLRGNHECRSVCSYFGFKDECEMKYGTQVFNACMEAFQAMPIAAVVESSAGRFFCLHGGISPNVTSLEQFKDFDRFQEPGMGGFLCDILWSDPVKDDHDDGADQSLGDFLSIDYLPNPARGCSYRYGFRALVTFLATNKLTAVIRAHEVQEEGYRYHFQELTGAKGKTNAHVTPPVITVFSAPNYCGRYGNLGAFIRIHDKVPGRRRAKLKSGVGLHPMQVLDPVQFISVPHPPAFNFENAAKKEAIRIETVCPYMPSTFYTFIKRAIELVSSDIENATLAKQSINSSPPPPSSSSKGPPPLPSQDSKPEAGKKKGGAKPKGKNWKAAALLGLDQGDDDDTSAALEAAQKKDTRGHKEYKSAAEADGLNEMNPALLQEKIEMAKLKVQRAGGIGLLGLTTKKGVVTPAKKEKRKSRMKLSMRLSKRSLVSKVDEVPTNTTKGPADNVSISAEKTAFRPPPPEPTDDDDGIDVRSDKEGRLSDKATTNVDAENDAMTFTTQELVALQLLFLLIDLKGDGKIDANDLVTWSEDDGTAVPLHEAEMCIQAVDSDQDGSIGFEDYLIFASRCKEKWLLTQYNNVLNDIKDMSSGRPPPPPVI